jgi:hypothetical protein
MPLEPIGIGIAFCMVEAAELTLRRRGTENRIERKEK